MYQKKLIILEMANNHMGSVNHGIEIIETYSILLKKFPTFQFAFKLQYRNLETFIRQDYKGRTDLKHIKRFEETRLSRADQKKLVKTIKNNGFLSMCTPFDNESIGHIIDDDFDYIKIASCSFGDWPLIEDIVATKKPLVASTAGAELDTIDNVITFFQNRNIDFIIQHCIGEYPTDNENMNLNQIDFLKSRHPDVKFGFSTHESPDETSLVQMAISKGVVSLEKHVGVPKNEWPLNLYSSNIDQTISWLNAAQKAEEACGKFHERYTPSSTEKKSLLSLQRGAFVKKEIKAGSKISLSKKNIYFAFPASENQLNASNFSKYSEITSKIDLKKDHPILIEEVSIINSKKIISDYAKKAYELLIASNISLPEKFDLELSHHYGLDKFEEFGLTMLTQINRNYCKKILICLPNQLHPEQYHNEKEETFNIIYGTLKLEINDKINYLKPGDIVTILPKERHKFVSSFGAVIEEISTTHKGSDSFYTDLKIQDNKHRKSYIKWFHKTK